MNNTAKDNPRPRKALVVEDHPALAFLLSRVLAGQSIEVETLTNGMEAIVCLQDRASEYGLVCSDVELPGASGWTILKWVRTHQPALPMMLISGVNDEKYLETARRRGAVAAFQKPFSTDEVQQALVKIFSCP